MEGVEGREEREEVRVGNCARGTEEEAVVEVEGGGTSRPRSAAGGGTGRSQIGTEPCVDRRSQMNL